ncbi:MAG: hypothetical protein CYPHOPRED_001172 [Cyphobasidiales sp. Tagirdzhanova-0007]|nr:MAG: hypothetical protein CYPHOPRED_001172 [Cyphobasidiales sp. Tagirdzhanova-0007]
MAMNTFALPASHRAAPNAHRMSISLTDTASLGETGHTMYPKSRGSRSRRQILPPVLSHPLSFVPGSFTRDGAVAACGPDMQLAAVDAYNWGQATTMTGGAGAWVRSWNTDSYEGTCIALYSTNSINVPPQGCSQLLAALCEPSTSPPPSAPAPPADDDTDPPADDPAPDDPSDDSSDDPAPDDGSSDDS